MKAFAKRNLGKTVWLIFIGLAIAICGTFSSTAYAKTAAEINASVNQTLTRFYREVNGAKELTSKAKALLVMPNVTKPRRYFGAYNTFTQTNPLHPVQVNSLKRSSTFFHPDFTVGSGVTPDHASSMARGLYHRSGMNGKPVVTQPRRLIYY